MTPRVRMHLLGGFALEYESAPVTITSQRIQALLAYLALHRAESQPRQRLAFLLWPDSTESQAHTNLRTLLHRLYAVFPQVDVFLQIDSQEINWRDSGAFALDVDDFEEAIRQISAADDSAVIAALEQAIASYSGDLMPDCYDDWIVPLREQLQHSLFTALEQIATRLEGSRAYSTAIAYARRLVSLDPFNESVCLTLMRLYTLNGDRASALRVYHTYVSTLQTELGTAPSASLHRAYERLLEAEAAPIETQPAQMNIAPLVGRLREWKRMQVTWQAAASGQARLLILWGEAGIGKTRLAEDLLTWATRQGIITATARCYAAEGDLAYTPVTALLRSEALRPGIARLSKEWLTEISRLAPDLLGVKPEIEQPTPLTEGWQRQRLFEALARAVLARSRPTMLLLDDLQWCDRDTLEWLHFLMRYQPSAGLLVVGTVRAEEVDTDHALTQLLEALRRESRVAEISLDPLSREETAELAGHFADRALSRERSDDLYRETEGNPLFVVETLRLHDEVDAPESLNAASDAALALPPTIYAVVTRRLRQLSPAAHALLEVASVIGRSFTFEVVAQTVDLSEDAVVRGLDELWLRRIIREHGSDAYDFTHDKLRAVAYAELSSARERILHRRVAETLERSEADDLDAVSGQIAMHYQKARLMAKAAAYHRRAADYARRLFANEVAINHLRQALELLGDDQPETADLYEQLGGVLHFIGRYDEARDAWQHALDVTPEGERITRAELYRKLGNAWRDQYRHNEALNAYDDAEAALGSLHDDDDEAIWFCWSQIIWERINVFYWLGQMREMIQLTDQIQVLFEQHGSPIQQVRLHHIQMSVYLRLNRYDMASPQAAEHADKYLKMNEAAGDTNALPAAHFQLGFSLLWGAGDLDAAEQEIQTALVLAQRSGDLSLEGRCFTYLTVIARIRGDVDQVRRYASDSLRVAEAGQMHDYIGAAHGNLAWLKWRSGDNAGARSEGQAALESWKQLLTGYMFEWLGRWPLIAVALADDDMEEALSQARVLLEERQKRMAAPIEGLIEAAVQAAAVDDRAASRRCLEQAAEAAPQVGYL